MWHERIPLETFTVEHGWYRPQLGALRGVSHITMYKSAAAK